MAQETVLALLNGITGDNATRRLILANALDVSQIDKIKPAARLTSPVVRGLFPSRVEAYATLEGAAKTVTSGNANTMQYTVQAISIVVPVSVALDRSEKDFKDSLVSQMVAGLARGIDRNIIRNSEGVYASSLVAAAAAASNTGNAASGTAITYAEMSSTFGLVEADGYTPTGAVVRNDLKGALRASETTGGNRFFVPSDRAEADTIFGVPVGYANTAVTPKVMETGAGKAMVIVGDFDQGLDWGIYGDFDVTVNPFAEEYFLTNRVLIRAEVYMGFAILNNSAFATLLQP